MSEENKQKKKRGRPPKKKQETNLAIMENKSLNLKSQDNVQLIMNAISNGESVELDIDKNEMMKNFNTFMLTQAYGQLPTIIKLYELQMRCLDEYYKQVNELLDDEDANVFLLDKIITTINNCIDRCNNIIMKLGLNSDITDQLMIKHVDNSQNININAYQSQISKQKVLDTVRNILEISKTTNNINEEDELS